jgi:NAD(P)-dependent dehydrogenase (short-subunit alcohol dehydrogenase family)
MSKLVNKTALITGGNSGIGFATAAAFLAEGAQVIITGRNQARVAEAVDQLGKGAHGIVSDAGNLADVHALPQKVKAIFPRLDILFFNAGVAQFAPFSEMPAEVFDANFNINFRGAFFTTQQLLPLINDGGSIIFNGTVLANRTMAGNAAYGASKAALVHLTKTLAVELADRKIRVNTVSPGGISTPIYSKLGMNEEELNAFAGGFIPKIPLERFGEAAEIAKPVVFLASDESSYVTGSEFTVDGGTAVQW